MNAECLMTNCRNRAPAHEAMCAKHRDPYGDGLIGRIDALEDRLASASEIIAQIEPDFRHPPTTGD